MDEILNLKIDEMAGCDFDCSCGRHHSFSLHDMRIRSGAINDLPEVAADFKDEDILVVFDNNTYEVAGKRALEILKNAGFKHVREMLFDTGSDILIPDAITVGRILFGINKETKLVIGVGSGVINDTIKYATSRAQIPYIIVATAPSMDGYVSAGCPVLFDGLKISLVGDLTYAVIGDTEILKTAPDDLIQAGFGDVVGKITALVDWDLAVKANGDYRCDTCVKLVQSALDKCFKTVEGLPKRDEAALGALMEALTLTGVTMALVGISRPASGSEHILSHYWEMDYVARGLNPVHHGVTVGVATPVVCRMFEELADLMPEGVMDWLVPSAEVKDLLAKAGSPVTPKDAGISKDLFHKSVLEAYKIRDRYSILRFAVEKGLINELADKLTEEIYG